MSYTESTALLNKQHRRLDIHRQELSQAHLIINVAACKDSKDSNGLPILSNTNCLANGDYCGLTLDELLPFVDDPWWRAVRRIFFCTFWLTLMLTFAAACTLAYLQSDGQAGTQCAALPTSTAALSNSTMMITYALSTATKIAI